MGLYLSGRTIWSKSSSKSNGRRSIIHQAKYGLRSRTAVKKMLLNLRLYGKIELYMIRMHDEDMRYEHDVKASC